MSKTQASGNGVSEHVTAKTDVALVQGFLDTCARCGEGRMIRAFLKANDRCYVCGRNCFTTAFMIFRLMPCSSSWGHLLLPAVLHVEIHFAPPYWMDVALWLPMTLILTIGLLQPTKGAIVAPQWSTGLHGFDRSKRAWELAHSDGALTHVDQGPRSVRCIEDSIGDSKASGSVVQLLDALPLNLIGPRIVSDLIYRLLIDGELVTGASARRSDGRGRGLIGIRRKQHE
jgi:uncharacterized protein (DUF983 family)